MPLMNYEFSGYLDGVKNEITVYSGPTSVYSKMGSLYADETMTVLEKAENNQLYIEYSTSSGTKRGYIPATAVKGLKLGTIVKLENATDVYSGPDTSYLDIGGIYEAEYAIALEYETGMIYNGSGASNVKQEWLYVEYNTSGGRKRGYININDIKAPTIVKHEISASDNTFFVGSMKIETTVYSGASTASVVMGSVFDAERVTVFKNKTENGYYLIEYNTTSKPKRGYIPISSVIKAPDFVMPTIEGANIDAINYGKSEQGRNQIA